MNIGIIGCGWLGTRIANHFKDNHKILVTTTTQSKVEPLENENYFVKLIDFKEDAIDVKINAWKYLDNIDCLIITIPFSKKANAEHITYKFNNLINFIKGFDKQLIMMSSVGIYPQIELEIFEHTLIDDDLNQSILLVENLMKAAFNQINILRLGGLMGDNRKLNNYQTSNNNQVVNHVHYLDVCKAIEAIITSKIDSKTYNVVAPLHPTKTAILNFQNNENQIDNSAFGRVIHSDLLIKELNFMFTKPDPIKF